MKMMIMTKAFERRTMAIFAFVWHLMKRLTSFRPFLNPDVKTQCVLVVGVTFVKYQLSYNVWLFHESVVVISNLDIRLLWLIMNLSILWLCLSEINSVNNTFNVFSNFYGSFQSFKRILVLNWCQAGTLIGMLLFMFCIIVSFILCLYYIPGWDFLLTSCAIQLRLQTGYPTFFFWRWHCFKINYISCMTFNLNLEMGIWWNLMKFHLWNLIRNWRKDCLKIEVPKQIR